MRKDNVNDADRVLASLRAMSIGSYLFQCQVAADLNLHATDLQALHAIGRSGSLTAGELATQLGLTTGATTAAIDRLERLGYLLRGRDASDRRKVVLSLRDEAARPLRAKYRNIDARVRALLASRSKEEVAVIAGFLEELVQRER